MHTANSSHLYSRRCTLKNIGNDVVEGELND